MHKNKKIYITLGSVAGVGAIVTPIATAIVHSKNVSNLKDTFIPRVEDDRNKKIINEKIKPILDDIDKLKTRNEELVNGEWPLWITHLAKKLDKVLERIYEIEKTLIKGAPNEEKRNVEND